MKQSLAWIEKFITPEQQEELMQLSPEKQLETLCDLLTDGHLKTEQYLNWASHFYQLPSLDSKFFEQVDITETWKKYNSLGIWSPELLPIQEWDNRLMIACAMPPSTFNPQFEFEPQFVIASPLDLKSAWSKLQSELILEKLNEPAPLDSMISETKELAMNFDFKPDESFKVIDFSIDDMQIDHLASESPDVPPVLDAAPEGIILNFELPKEEVSAPRMPTFEMPEPDRTLRVQNQEMILKSPPPQKKPTLAPVQASPSAPIIREKVSTSPQLKPVIPAPEVSEGSFSGKKDLKRSSKVTKNNFEECTSFEEIADLMFFKIRDHFDMSMLMLCQERTLMPWYWSGDFKPSSDQNSQIIKLEQASIFKVVFDSHKPYHGHVITNAINARFFAEWNSGEIPKHVTIVPIFVEKVVAGMWFAATNKNIDLELSLSELDALAAQSSISFLRALQEAA
jgi:hypothetical protein